MTTWWIRSLMTANGSSAPAPTTVLLVVRMRSCSSMSGLRPTCPEPPAAALGRLRAALGRLARDVAAGERLERPAGVRIALRQHDRPALVDRPGDVPAARHQH